MGDKIRQENRPEAGRSTVPGYMGLESLTADEAVQSRTRSLSVMLKALRRRRQGHRVSLGMTKKPARVPVRHERRGNSLRRRIFHREFVTQRATSQIQVLCRQPRNGILSGRNVQCSIQRRNQTVVKRPRRLSWTKRHASHGELRRIWRMAVG